MGYCRSGYYDGDWTKRLENRFVKRVTMLFIVEIIYDNFINPKTVNKHVQGGALSIQGFIWL